MDTNAEKFLLELADLLDKNQAFISCDGSTINIITEEEKIFTTNNGYITGHALSQYVFDQNNCWYSLRHGEINGN